MQLTIRPAQAHDAGLLAALSVYVWLDTYATEGIREELAEHVLAEFTTKNVASLLDDSSRLILVAESNSHILGYIQVRFGAMTNQSTAIKQVEVEHIYVLPGFSRMGIGRDLLDQAGKAAAGLGYDFLWLSAWIGNIGAQRFYEAVGYDQIRRTLFIMGSEEHENLVYSKVI